MGENVLRKLPLLLRLFLPRTCEVSTIGVFVCNTLKTMKKRELIQAVATHTDVDNKTAAKLVEGTIDVILANVAKGEIVNISGFAKFAKIKRPARMARNPATGEQIKVKAKTVAKITALKGFKDIALGVAAAPKVNTVRKAAPAPAKKAPAKKAPAKKAPAKKAPAKKAPAKKVVKKAVKKK
jgi:DNA-binding protein HU-beta